MCSTGDPSGSGGDPYGHGGATTVSGGDPAHHQTTKSPKPSEGKHIFGRWIRFIRVD